MIEINKIYNEDCRITMANMPDEFIDLTVTSPPYDNLRTYNDNVDQTWNEAIWKPVIKELYRVTKSGGVVVWIVADATINGSETGTSFRQALWAMECGFNLHDTMIWQKSGFSAVGALQVRYAPVFEYMFVFTKETIRIFNPIKDRKNAKHGKTLKGSTVRNKDGSTKPVSNPNYIIPKYGQRFNIWQVDQVYSRIDTRHVAPFPEQLANDHIISWSNENDLVYDPFIGSGTTAKMALVNNRNFIGSEISKEYCDIANERIGVIQKKLI